MGKNVARFHITLRGFGARTGQIKRYEITGEKASRNNSETHHLENEFFLKKLVLFADDIGGPTKG